MNLKIVKTISLKNGNYMKFLVIFYRILWGLIMIHKIMKRWKFCRFYNSNQPINENITKKSLPIVSLRRIHMSWNLVFDILMYSSNLLMKEYYGEVNSYLSYEQMILWCYVEYFGDLEGDCGWRRIWDGLFIIEKVLGMM